MVISYCSILKHAILCCAWSFKTWRRLWGGGEGLWILPEDSVRLGRTRSPTLLTPRDLDSASGIKRRPPRQSNPATDQPHIPRHSRPPSQLVQQHFCCSVLCGNAKIVFLLEKFLEGKWKWQNSAKDFLQSMAGVWRPSWPSLTCFNIKIIVIWLWLSIIWKMRRLDQVNNANSVIILLMNIWSEFRSE